MKPWKPFLLVVCVFCIVLGFNTLDVMMWHASNEYPWLLPDGLWDMGPFWIGKWWAYAIFGILLYGVGVFLLGWICKEVSS